MNEKNERDKLLDDMAKLSLKTLEKEQNFVQNTISKLTLENNDDYNINTNLKLSEYMNRNESHHSVNKE